MDIPISVTAIDNASAVLQQVEGSLSSFATAAVVAAGTAAAAVAGVVSIDLAKNLAKEYDSQAEAMRGLTSQQQAFALSLEKTLGVRDKDIAAVMKQAAIAGVSADKLEAVTKATLGVARSLDVDYKNALQKVLDPGKELEKVQNAAVAGLDKMKATMGTATGAGIALSNNMQQLRQTLGGVFAPAVELGTNAISMLADSINSILLPAVDIAKAAFEVAAPVIKQFSDVFLASAQYVAQNAQRMFMAIAEVFVGIVTAADVAWNNASQLTQFGIDTMLLAATTFSEELKYLLTVKMPYYVVWFADNFVNMMRDAAVAVITVIRNMGTNLGEAFYAIFSWINSGMEGGLEGLSKKLGDGLYRGMLDGFKASTQALPDIMARQMTEAEKAIAERLVKNGMNLGEKFNEGFKARMDQLNGLLGANGFDPASGVIGAITGKITSAASELKATESRLQTRGRADDPMQQAVDLLKGNNNLLGQIVRNTEPKSGVTLEVANLA